ncbi:hypothetical protein ACWPM6_10990 [Propionibacterium freudenreichii]|uniref:hypothetical protein n=2 Tax=Propionibacterium freudenreichii TaxID=1744 RepID=UPI00254A3EBA|nr:hypothetical protein [Propionibacterium freudenreichii]MDK9319946.1 hypothetical protein [Propionibacterium freudenreichii]MDK9344963.1 hypothetical protein [Propionibacterium freudenreichii]MDK9643806.1 hypothetical protein [Propionibacterium freudenreichii]MDK9668763.1 hypothetical protein [Propionibacterium freudenreichii]
MTEIDIHTHTALSDAEAVVRRADGGLDDATKPATGFTRQLNAGVAERLGIRLFPDEGVAHVARRAGASVAG